MRVLRSRISMFIARMGSNPSSSACSRGSSGASSSSSTTASMRPLRMTGRIIAQPGSTAPTPVPIRA